MSNKQQEAQLESALKTSAAVLSGASGTVLGFAVGGPVRAILGGATPTLLQVFGNVAIDTLKRTLSDRELSSTKTSLEIAQQTIARNIGNGIPVRDDDFFILTEFGRSMADEVVEATVRI